MRKFLSVLLALMMVVSTVSFAAPAVVTVADSATDAVAENATEVTTENEMAELTAESDYGTLVYSVDFERSDFDVTKFSTAYASLMNNPTAAYLNTDFNYSNVTTYSNGLTPNTSGVCDGIDNAKLVTENDNTYIQGDVDAGYDGFFRMSKYGSHWPKGQYTFTVDVKVPAGQAAGFTAQCNDTKIALNTLSAFSTASGDWQTVVYQTTNVVRGENTGSTDTEGLYGFFVTPNNAAAGTVAYDNWKIYYKADTATVTIDPNGRTGNSEVWVENLTAKSQVDVKTLVTKAQEMDSDVIGLATEPAGEAINTLTHYVEYYERLYAVYGFTVTVDPNGNADFGNDPIVIPGIDTRLGYTIGQVVDLFNKESAGMTTKVLRGFATASNGDPLPDDTVINTTQTLYAIWEIDESEYGTLLWNIDFEREDAMGWFGHTRDVKNSQNDNGAYVCEVASEYHPAFENFNHRVRFVINDGEHFDQGIVEDSNGNHYMTGTALTRYPQIYSTNYGGMKADGVYTLVFDAMSSSTESGIGINKPADAKWLDTWTVAANKWDKAVVQYEVTGGAAMPVLTFNFNYATTGQTISYDNVKLYFKPTGNLNVTVDANGNKSASNVSKAVNPETGITAGELEALMPGCIGIAKTADGTILSDSEKIVPTFNTNVYAVWGFNVTLDAGQNTEMTNVIVSDIDTRVGTTIGDLLAEIENTTDRVLRGLSKSANGDILGADTKVTSESTYYMIWELEESEYGTLLFQIDFEKDGISTPSPDEYVDVNDITDIYNEDLVLDKVYFGARYSSSNELVTSGNNTYLVSTGKDGSSYINLYAKEASDYIDWLDGTYTAMVDAMVLDTKATAVVSHVNDLATGITANLVDSFSNEIGVWDTVTYTFSGKLSYDELKNHYYIAFNMPEGKQIAFDNFKLYFKTDETVVTLKANGNSDLSDIEVPVSTSTGITVAELIEEVNQYPTTHTLLGISDSGTGELLAEDTVIKPSYQETYYLIWQTADNDPTISTQYGKLLFNVDFERDSILESGWDGHLSLDDNKYTAGSFPTHIASYYDEDVFTGKNFRIKFLTSDVATNASIKTDASGNNYLSGTSSTRWPQIAIANNDKLVIGAGYYTVFFDSYSKTGTAASMGVNTPSGSTILEGGNSANTAFSVPNGEWKSYAFKFELNEGAVFPNMVVNYSLAASDKGSATVGWDDFKVYFKPYEATVTILPGDYEEFGETTITGIDTTTATTLETVISSMMEDINISGRGFAGLMDQYGEMVDLTKSVIIPCDMTYTIIWEEENEYAPVTWKSNSIRYSTKVNSRGIRFAADTTTAVTNEADEYGWVIARTDVLENAGIRATSLTKDSSVNKIIGKNYDPTVDANDRKHFSEDDDAVVITAVIYGVPEKYYRYEFTVRPYMVVDGVHYYGKPWSRSIYDTAVAVRDAGYPTCDEDLVNYIDTIIANTPAE